MVCMFLVECFSVVMVSGSWLGAGHLRVCVVSRWYGCGGNVSLCAVVVPCDSEPEDGE